MSDRKKLLLVDDSKENIRVLVELLKRDYQLNALTDSYKAVDTAASWKPDVILLDVVMPELSGYDVCALLKACPKTSGIPVIFITGVSDPDEEIACINAGALDYVTKPINPRLLNAKIKNFIEIKNDRTLLSRMLEAKKAEIDNNVGGFMGVALGLSEFRDADVGSQHIKRCVEYAKILVKSLLTNPDYAEITEGDAASAICGAIPFHDIGKSVLPDEIILKPEKLTPEEFDIAKRHVLISERQEMLIRQEIEDDELARFVLDIIRYHHERWDGTGYPDGLKGNAIPLCARIMALADQYDALTSKRVYREPTYHFEAVRTIMSESGKGLDPGLVREFLNVQEEFLEIMRKYSDVENVTEAEGGY